MQSDQSFLQQELCKAPDYRLEKNTTKELPKVDLEATKAVYLDSLAAVSAAQIFEEVPGIEKVKILVDARTSFEIWNLMPSRVLLPQDVEILRSDRARVEAIIKTIVGVFDCWLSSEILEQKLQVHSWEEVLELLENYKYEFDFINISYTHPRVQRETRTVGQDGVEYWAIYPPCLTIKLIKTRGLNGGYIVDDYNSLYNFQIEAFAGLPLFRNIQTGTVATLAHLQQGNAARDGSSASEIG